MVIVHVVRTFETIDEAQRFADKMTEDGKNTKVYFDEPDNEETSH